MNTLKLLNLFVIAFVLSFLVQYFFFPKTTTPTPVNQGVSLSVKADSIVVPNIPVITIHNTTSGSVAIDPCSDITLRSGEQTFTGIATFAPTFCQNIAIPTGSSALLPMTPLYKIFANSANVGHYTVTLKTMSGSDTSVNFSLEKAGFFRSFLSSVVYAPIYNFFVAILTFLPGHPLGWAIIIITLIIRLILLVPQNQMLQSQKKMQKIQPKIKALQKEHKDDQAALGVKMMELYKAEGVNPMGSCLPLIIQMPILIGLYWVVSGISDPSNYYYLYSVFAHFDPTEISTMFAGINLSGVGGILGIVFAIILGVTQWVQAYLSFQYTDKKTHKQVEQKLVETDINDPVLDPAMMQKMMLYFFPLMLAVSSYFFPYGVALYWFIGTLFLIAQQWYANTHTK